MRRWEEVDIEADEFIYPGQMALTLIARSKVESKLWRCIQFCSGQATYVICWGASLTASVDVRWFTIRKFWFWEESRRYAWIYWPAALLGWSRGDENLSCGGKIEVMGGIRTTPCSVALGAKWSFTMWFKGGRWGDVDNTCSIEVGWAFCKKIWKAGKW